jgi:hypothetical protein
MRGEKNHNSSIFLKKFSATPLSLTVNSSLISNIQVSQDDIEQLLKQEENEPDEPDEPDVSDESVESKQPDEPGNSDETDAPEETTTHLKPVRWPISYLLSSIKVKAVWR